MLVWCRGACLLTAAFYFVRFSATLRRRRGSFFSVSFSQTKQRVSHSLKPAYYKSPQRVDYSAPSNNAPELWIDIRQSCRRRWAKSIALSLLLVHLCCTAAVLYSSGGRTSRFLRTLVSVRHSSFLASRYCCSMFVPSEHNGTLSNGTLPNK